MYCVFWGTSCLSSCRSSDCSYAKLGEKGSGSPNLLFFLARDFRVGERCLSGARELEGESVVIMDDTGYLNW